MAIDRSQSWEKRLYKTKLITYEGCSTRIILQRADDRAPLVAICNVLLLRNPLILGVNYSEVSVDILLSLVAEKSGILFSNPEGWLDLLPCLATGFNVRIRRTTGFEPMLQLDIFDLLGIKLCHGCVVDSEVDAVTIGSMFYDRHGKVYASELSESPGEDQRMVRNCRKSRKSFSTTDRRRGDEEVMEGLRTLNLTETYYTPLNMHVQSNTGSSDSSPCSDRSSQSQHHEISSCSMEFASSDEVSMFKMLSDECSAFKDLKSRPADDQSAIQTSIEDVLRVNCDMANHNLHNHGLTVDSGLAAQSIDSYSSEEANYHESAIVSSDKAGIESSKHEGNSTNKFLNEGPLTLYGLSRLREAVKEGEPCILFHENHFSTMLKHNSELYLLAAEQCFINQPNLVWEKLSEVQDDRQFMTGHFQVFEMKTCAENLQNEEIDKDDLVMLNDPDLTCLREVIFLNRRLPDSASDQSCHSLLASAKAGFRNNRKNTCDVGKSLHRGD